MDELVQIVGALNHPEFHGDWAIYMARSVEGWATFAG